MWKFYRLRARNIPALSQRLFPSFVIGFVIFDHVTTVARCIPPPKILSSCSESVKCYSKYIRFPSSQPRLLRAFNKAWVDWGEGNLKRAMDVAPPAPSSPPPPQGTLYYFPSEPLRRRE